MPWEKSFDEESAIENAMKLFWEKGFEASSMADIIEHTGINRGSIYNAFGGKNKLFVLALLKYETENRKAMIAELEAMDKPREAIEAFFDAVVNETVSDSEKKGCFLVNTASELNKHDDEVNKIVTNGLRETEAFFQRSIEVGQARDEINSSVDPVETAKALLGLVVGIRVLGRAVFSKESLESLASQAKQLIS